MHKLTQLVSQLALLRQRPCLLLASSQLDIDLLPALHQQLVSLGEVPQLDVVLYSRGGIVNAARRIALLLREHCEYLTFIVPHYCESAGTILSLAANHIIASPLAIFSPIDPLLSAAADHGPHAMSAQDIRLFQEMASNWFGFDEQQAKQTAFSILSQNIFPTTLTSFYRSCLEVESIAEQLLTSHIDDGQLRQRVVQKLCYGFHSHSYALTGQDLTGLGLSVQQTDTFNELLIPIAEHLRLAIGPAARQCEQDQWHDALFCNSVHPQHASTRVRSEQFPGRWQRVVDQ